MRGVRDRGAGARDRARAARREASVAESWLWETFRRGATGFRFRREVPMGPYRLDLYCPEARLCVEADGEQHDPARDAVRDAWLAERGIVTIRIPNVEIFARDRDGFSPWVRRIVARCEERSGRLAHEPRTEAEAAPSPRPESGGGGFGNSQRP